MIFLRFHIYLKIEISENEKSHFDPMAFHFHKIHLLSDTKYHRIAFGWVLNKYLIAFGNRYYIQFPLNYISADHWNIGSIIICVFLILIVLSSPLSLADGVVSFCVRQMSSVF